MNTTHKRLALGILTGLCMSLVVWLFVSEHSPAYHFLLQQPELGYGVLILNLPALFASRVVSGSPPMPLVVYAACFVQWFALGLALSLAVWRRTPSGAGV